jgi:hypothetical protein
MLLLRINAIKLSEIMLINLEESIMTPPLINMLKIYSKKKLCLM